MPPPAATTLPPPAATTLAPPGAITFMPPAATTPLMACGLRAAVEIPLSRMLGLMLPARDVRSFCCFQLVCVATSCTNE
ncbi:MAG: hypothetical protein EOP50_08120 [Sphingobacteriales bacterium]|nr:MAG: hypothetical protein EOP50_08120 [Sphingobacteriales bacterium]